MENIFEQLMAFATGYGLRIIGAVLILIIGRITAGLLRNLVKKLLVKSNVDPAVVTFLGSMVYIGVIVFAVLAALM